MVYKTCPEKAWAILRVGLYLQIYAVLLIQHKEMIKSFILVLLFTEVLSTFNKWHSSPLQINY